MISTKTGMHSIAGLPLQRMKPSSVRITYVKDMLLITQLLAIIAIDCDFISLYSLMIEIHQP